MKISKQKVQQIIREELEMAYSAPKTRVNSPNSAVDLEGKEVKEQLKRLAKYALGLYMVLEEDQELESWVQSKITLADDYLTKVKHHLENDLQVDVPEPDLEKAIDSCNKEPELPENDNYAGQGSFYYEV
jgi:hypothetical protein